MCKLEVVQCRPVQSRSHFGCMTSRIEVPAIRLHSCAGDDDGALPFDVQIRDAPTIQWLILSHRLYNLNCTHRHRLAVLCQCSRTWEKRKCVFIFLLSLRNIHQRRVDGRTGQYLSIHCTSAHCHHKGSCVSRQHGEVRKGLQFCNSFAIKNFNDQVLRVPT